jgi:hypothetical protein
MAEIIGTDATTEKLAEPKAWIANDAPLMNDEQPLAQGRVLELIDILTDLESNQADDETGPAATWSLGSDGNQDRA